MKMEIDMKPCQASMCKKKIGGYCFVCKFNFQAYQNGKDDEINHWKKIINIINSNTHKDSIDNIMMSYSIKPKEGWRIKYRSYEHELKKQAEVEAWMNVINISKGFNDNLIEQLIKMYFLTIKTK